MDKRQFIKRTISADFGKSYITNKPVFPSILDKIPYTLQLAFFSILFAVFFGAFGAHALDLEDNAKDIYKTASFYHFQSVFLIFIIDFLSFWFNYDLYFLDYLCIVNFLLTFCMILLYYLLLMEVLLLLF